MAAAGGSWKRGAFIPATFSQGTAPARLALARGQNVAEDRALYIEARTATPERRAEIDRQRRALSDERTFFDFGAARGRQLVSFTSAARRTA